MMAYLLYVAVALAIGGCVAMQPPINAVMSRQLASPLLAACISIAISLAFVLLVWLTAGKGAGDLEQLKTLPWWVTIGGVVGVFFVLGGVMVAPMLGLALFFVCIVAGQLVGSTLADHFGIFGMPVKPVNAMKLLGLVLVLAGAALVETSDS